MTRVLVTGAEGFVGRRLVARLVERGAVVIACHAPGSSGSAEASTAGAPPSVLPVGLDIRDRDEVHRVFDETQPEAVVHLAGRSNVAASWRQIGDYYRTNVEGSDHVAAAVRALPAACRLVVASSAETYGPVPEAELPVSEARGLEPGSPYALTKAAVERLSLPQGAVAVRFFNLIGPGQGANFALPSFAAQLADIEAGREEPVLRTGDLASRRDFVHVDDGAAAITLLLDRGVPGSAYNVARGEATSLRAALERLIEISGLEVEIRRDPDRLRPADVPVMCGDASRLRALGWRPGRSFDQALDAIWQDARRRRSDQGGQSSQEPD